MLFKCSVCNFTYEGDEAPDFAQNVVLQKNSTNWTKQPQKVYASDETNDLLMKFVAAAHDLIPLCERGIEINLIRLAAVSSQKPKMRLDSKTKCQSRNRKPHRQRQMVIR